jgi:hypothetical protein
MLDSSVAADRIACHARATEALRQRRIPVENRRQDTTAARGRNTTWQAFERTNDPIADSERMSFAGPQGDRNADDSVLGNPTPQGA